MKKRKVHKVTKDEFKLAFDYFQRVFGACGVDAYWVTHDWHKVTCKRCLAKKGTRK